MPTYEDGTAALRTLTAFVGEKLAEEVLADSSLQNAKAVLKTAAYSPQQQVGHPTVFLAMNRDEQSQWAGGVDSAYDLEAGVECKASGFSGSVAGPDVASNLEGSDIILSRSVAQIFKNNRAEMEALGFEVIQYRGESQTLETGTNTPADFHNNRGRVFLTYWRS